MAITLNYDERLCGRGKTTDLWKRINESDEQFLVVSPTLQLNNQQADGIADCRRIDTETTKSDETVREALLDAIGDNQHRSIVATHRSLPALIRDMREEAFRSLGNYNLVLDEAFTDSVAEMTFTFGHEIATLLLDEWVDIRPSDLWPDVWEVADSGSDRLLELASEETGCSVLNNSKELQKFASKVLDPLYRTFIHKTGLGKLQAEKNNKRLARFTVVSFLCPTAFADFKSVTCLSAFFQDTEYALIASALGVDFLNTTPDSTCPTYANSKRLTIHYVTERKWTSEYRQLLDEDGRSNIGKLTEFIRERMGSSPFIFNAHRDDRPLLDGWEKAELVTETHGRKDLRHHTKAAFLGSRNATPELGVLLSAMEVRRDEIDSARTLLAGYQLFMRTNLRQESSTEEVEIYCTDRNMVDFMLKVFPDAAVKFHDMVLQDKKLGDRRKFNPGGAREGAGAKAKYPGFFEERHKK